MKQTIERLEIQDRQTDSLTYLNFDDDDDDDDNDDDDDDRVSTRMLISKRCLFAVNNILGDINFYKAVR